MHARTLGLLSLIFGMLTAKLANLVPSLQLLDVCSREKLRDTLYKGETHRVKREGRWELVTGKGRRPLNPTYPLT
jgi:hypothetical protein